MSEAELKDLAKSMGIKKVASMPKDDLVYQIIDQQAIDASMNAPEPPKRRRTRAKKETPAAGDSAKEKKEEKKNTKKSDETKSSKKAKEEKKTSEKNNNVEPKDEVVEETAEAQRLEQPPVTIKPSPQERSKGISTGTATRPCRT